MKISRRDLAIGALASPVAAVPATAAAQVERNEWISSLRSDHDLNLPAWGPYTKKYFGISHLPEAAKGVRFDIGFLPGFFRRTALIPNVLWESGYYPWEASPDLSYYCARFELEWKDRVYIDLSFSALSEKERLVCCEIVNQTESEQNLSLHFLASLHFPPPAHQVELPEGALWVDALDYADLRFASARPTDTLVADGLLRGEVSNPGFVGGHGVGQRFGADRGDTILFPVELKQEIPDAVLLVRYRNTDTSAARFRLEGFAKGTAEFPSSQEFAVARIVAGTLAAGKRNLRLTSLGGASLQLDGFAIVRDGHAAKVAFPQRADIYQPEISAGPRAASIVLKYKDVANDYGMAWDFDEFQIREFRCGDLDNAFRHATHDHVNRVISGPGQGHYTDIFLRPVALEPRSRRTIRAVACSGSHQEVMRVLAVFPHREGSGGGILDRARDSARRKRAADSSSSAGAAFAFSQERMAATVLSNVVYPLYIRRHYVRHNTPGRWWDSFYTWDSGFNGLGLLEHDLGRAADCLNTYTFPPGDPYAAYLQHGTPVPVQIYLFLEMWNRTQSNELLHYFYPRLRQIYLFLAGHSGSSSTRRLASQLLTTWDYFYNSGGWDDYPPQRYVHAHRLERSVAPACTTAHAIRAARILRMAALTLGRAEDVRTYDSDIRTWTEALQQNSWDEKSGYFGYIVHNDQGRATGILREPGGQNFNMGLDGVMPLVAGICTAQQTARLCQNLMSTAHLWTQIGITTVDQSAPYHRNDGYWNGAGVDASTSGSSGRPFWTWDERLEAYQIAHTALNLWQREVTESYNCYEHFLTQSGRGAGWHQFGGLSPPPVMSWFGDLLPAGAPDNRAGCLGEGE